MEDHLVLLHAFLLRRKVAYHDIKQMYGNEAEDSEDCDSWLVHHKYPHLLVLLQIPVIFSLFWDI